MVRIVVVDDHALFRAGLVTTLNNEADFKVVGEGVDGVDGIERVKQLQPDVVLLDLRMPKCDGLTALPQMLTDSPQSKVIVLSQSTSADDLSKSLKLGARGYLSKDIEPDQIARAIRDVVEGRPVISPSMAPVLVEQYTELVKSVVEPSARLSSRENEVLLLIGEGFNNRQIAERLTISENTVKNHVSNILDKLGLESRMQAVAYVLRAELGIRPE